jgi:hypothetical protein
LAFATRAMAEHVNRLKNGLTAEEKRAAIMANGKHPRVGLDDSHN